MQFPSPRMSAAECARAVNEAFRGTGLLRPTREALDAVPLPAASREFLQSGGLPKGLVFGFDFEPVRDLLTVRDYATSRGYPEVDDVTGAARCVGDSWGVLMVLDARSWNVLWTDPTGRTEGMFVNSDIGALGASLAAYVSLAPMRGALQPARLAADFERTLRGIDEGCVHGWWSTVIQEIGFGLS